MLLKSFSRGAARRSCVASEDGGYMKKKFIQISFFVAAIALCAGLAWYFDLMHYLSLATIKSHLLMLRESVNNCYPCALAVYVGLYIALSACMVPAVGPLTLVGGYLFGAYVGFCAAMGSLLCGIGISFTIMRYLSETWLPRGWQARREKFVARIKQYGAGYIFLLNVVTVVPFVVITTLAAFSEISFWKFIGASMLGSAPMLLMYAFAGRQLADITSLGQLFSPWFIGILILLASLSFIPFLVKRFTQLSIDDV